MAKTKKRPTSGRRASFNSIDRQTAREWAALYRKAQGEPGGLLCLNPGDEPEIQTWIDGNDPEHLLWMLERFAERGTFELVGPLMESIHLLPLRMEYTRRRAAGERHSAIVEDLAEKQAGGGVSSRTIERWVQHEKSRQK